MRARIEWMPGTDSYALYAWRDRGDGIEAMRFTDLDARGQPNYEWVPIKQGAESKPLLILPYWFYEAFREQFGRHADALQEVRAHLDDTTTVRDRLLSLIEREAA